MFDSFSAKPSTPKGGNLQSTVRANLSNPSQKSASNPALTELENRQDRLLSELEELNQRIEAALTANGCDLS